MKLTQFIGGALAWFGLVLLLGAAESLAAYERDPSCQNGSSWATLPVFFGFLGDGLDVEPFYSRWCLRIVASADGTSTILVVPFGRS